MKRILLPAEHGGWGFLFEPIFLGMLVAPTIAGTCYALAAIAAFLMRHPLKIAWRRRTSASPRSTAARRVAFGYAALALAGFVAAVGLGGWKPVLPLVILSPCVIVYAIYDSRNRSRSTLPELAGPAGLAATAPAIALAAGWPGLDAAALWILVMARTIPSIFYVRGRLRLERGSPVARTSTFWIHVVAVAIVAALVRYELAPVLAIAGILILAARATLGLSPYRRLSAARQIGFLEIFFGALYIFVVAGGFLSGL